MIGSDLVPTLFVALKIMSKPKEDLELCRCLSRDLLKLMMLPENAKACVANFNSNWAEIMADNLKRQKILARDSLQMND